MIIIPGSRVRRWPDIVRRLFFMIVLSVLFPAVQSGAVDQELPEVIYEVEPVAVGEHRREILHYDNPAGGVLNITGVDSSCDCVTVFAFQHRVEQQGAGWIDIEIAPDETGDYAYECTLRSGATRQVLRCVVYVTVPEKRVEDVPPRYLAAASLMDAALPFRIVDTRSSRAYADAHIPESLNIPPFSLRTKGFLKANPLVLVDDGWGRPATERLCRELSQQGFLDVRILFGGLNAWCSAGGTLAGSRPVPEVFTRMNATEFMTTRDREWLVVDACSAPDDDAELLFPGILKPAEVSERVAASESVGMRVLVVTQEGRHEGVLVEKLRACPGAVVFFLEGGMPEMQRHRQRSIAMQRSASTRTRSSAASGRARKSCSCN